MKGRAVSYNGDLIDLILLHVLKDIEEGTYVDVGANDPWDTSATKIFYDRGWSGINIEPLKECHDLLETDRPRDLNLCAGAGNCETDLVLYGDSQLATMDRTLASGKTQTIVKVMPLTKILDEHLSKGKEVHFCKIDVEGFEKQVLEGLDLNRYRPWIFVIESTAPCSTKPTFDKWEHILTDNGYVLALDDVYNRYYIDKAHIDLKERFVGKERLKDCYDVFVVTRAGPDSPYRPLKDTVWRIWNKIKNP